MYEAPIYARPAPKPPARMPEPVRPRPEPVVSKITLPGPEELGITLNEKIEIPPPGALGIDPK